MCRQKSVIFQMDRLLSTLSLEFDDDTEEIDMEDVLEYDGPRDLADARSLQARADTSEMTLSIIGDFFPRLEKLRLNNSVIPSIRDISSSLSRLRFLSLAHCDLRLLDGICTISSVLEELYLAFNHISDISDLIGLSNLKILDLEENEIASLADIELLQCCSSLKALTLAGNPGVSTPTYREDVHQFLPKLIYLDEKRLKPRNQQRDAAVTFSPPVIAVKPRSSEEPTREGTVTELIVDLANERPPTARGLYAPSRSNITGSWAKPKQKLIAKPVISPKLMRPVSSCLRVRKSAESPEKKSVVEVETSA
jgi:hypothetical protein